MLHLDAEKTLEWSSYSFVKPSNSDWLISEATKALEFVRQSTTVWLSMLSSSSRISWSGSRKITIDLNLNIFHNLVVFIIIFEFKLVKMHRRKQKMNIYRKIRLIGEGAFGKAFLVEHIKDKELLVIKQMDISKMTREER